MIYVATFANADGTFRRRRFAVGGEHLETAKQEAARLFGVRPVELSDARTGEVVYRERRER